jgi:hypothetical protein
MTQRKFLITPLVAATVFGVLAGSSNPALSQTQSRANFSGSHDVPFQADPEARTTEKRSGTALFSNDCPMNQKMYVTVRKNYGAVDVIVLPNNTVTKTVNRGDKFAARCGVVVARNAAFNWIKLNGSGD